jgi:hypothetical protein
LKGPLAVGDLFNPDLVPFVRQEVSERRPESLIVVVGLGVEPLAGLGGPLHLLDITDPSRPAFSTIWRIGSSRARFTIWTPVASSPA